MLGSQLKLDRIELYGMHMTEVEYKQKRFFSFYPVIHVHFLHLDIMKWNAMVNIAIDQTAKLVIGYYVFCYF